MSIKGGTSSPRNSCTPRDGRSDNYHEVKDSHLRMSKRQWESRTFLFLWLAVFSHSDKNIYWSLMMFEGGLPWVFNLSRDFAVAKSVKEKNLRKTENHLSKMIQRESWLFFWWLSACLCCCGLSLHLKHQTQLKLGGPSRCPCWPQDCSCRVLVEGGVERGTTGHHRHPQIPDGSDFPPTQCWNAQISPPPCKGGKSVLGTVLKNLAAGIPW